MTKSSNLGDDEDPREAHDSTVELSVNMYTSDPSRFPDLASSSKDSTDVRELLPVGGLGTLISSPHPYPGKLKPLPQVKVAPKPEPDASPNP
jgi:hypothetical protein